MKKLLLAIFVLLWLPTAAFTQAWTTGARPVSYPGGNSGSYAGVIGDGTTTQGGTAPAEANEPADIASNFDTAPWITNTGIGYNPAESEHKSRFVCNASHEAQEDPILYPGQANAGHRHTFVGNTLAGKDSTYAQLRASGNSTCPGGPVNRTAYWEPSILMDLPGKGTVSIKPDHFIFYYFHDAVHSPKKYRLVNGLAFIGGKNPHSTDTMNDTARKAEIPAGFTYITSGFKGWACFKPDGNPVANVDGTPDYPALQTPAGGDPWQGQCGAGGTLISTVLSPECWDGHNLTSPNGRDHFRYMIRHTNSGNAVCPTGWWQVPAFQAKAVMTHGGWADYSRWYAASDRMSADPAQWHRPGSSMHFDWMNGWDPGVLDQWLVNCTGIKIGVTPGNGAGCNYSTINSAQRLLSDSPSPDWSLPNPIVDLGKTYWDDPNSQRFFPIKAATQGTFTVSHKHSLFGGDGLSGREERFELPPWARGADVPMNFIMLSLGALAIGAGAFSYHRRLRRDEPQG